MKPCHKYCFFQDKIVTIDEIKISPYDLGFLRAYGVFDIMRTANGRPFLLDEHWERLKKSAASFDLKLPISKSEFSSILKKLLLKNGFTKKSSKNANIRTLLTGGESSDGFTYEGTPMLLILIETAPLPNMKLYQDGAKIVTMDYKREMPRVKYMDYKFAIASQKNKKNNAIEIIFTKDEYILEASISNVFVIKDHILFTPENEILKGITRGKVLEIAEKNNIFVKKEPIKVYDLLNADEVFITSSNKDVLPITKINDNIVNGGMIGPITKILMKDFLKVIENYSD